jgi:hypothetical protein
MDGTGPRPAEQALGPSIAFVVPYVGTWPAWFPAHLQSCKYNPTIRWIFFTDCEIPDPVPANVEFVHGSLREFERLVEQKTGLSVSLETPYKFCDYKPAYGLIFEDYLAGFDFWGHCDVDVVWGNIRKFLATDEILAGHDVVSPRKEIITGTCNLYRNTDEINRLFLADPKFKFVVRDPENIRYDERRWTRFVAKQAASGALRVHWPAFMQPHVLIDSVEWYWDRGAVFDCTDKWYWNRADDELFDYPDEVPGEVLYMDFRQWKKTSAVPCDFGYADDPPSFRIAHTGISAAWPAVQRSGGKDGADPAQ